MLTILEHRKKKGITQEELAAKLEVDRSVISKWENNELLPGTRNLIRLANIFACSMEELVDSKNKVANSG